MLYQLEANDNINIVSKKFGYDNPSEFFKTMRYAGDSKVWMAGTVIECPSKPSSPRDRPYDGQSHTDAGLRGKTFVHGLTMRDIHDCLGRAYALSMGETNPGWYEIAEMGGIVDPHKLDWSSFDPVAIQQNLTCEIERMMGIFPNVPEVEHEG